MLLDTFPNPGDRNAIGAVLQRRLQYLIARADAVAKREPDSLAPPWRSSVVQATLWMEAAESAVALDQYAEARRGLRNAIQQFLRLRLPIGAALQRTFFAGDKTLDSLAREVMQSWREALETDTANVGPETSTLVRAAQETAQQWAYFVLAEGGADGQRKETSLGSDRLTQRLATMSATPLGRLRLPLDHYHAVARVSGDAFRFRGDVTLMRQRGAAEVIAKSLVGLYRSLQWASANTYLWRRLLAPAPLFDLDTALIVARAQETQQSLKTSLVELSRSMIADEARKYADAFVHAVDTLSKPEAG